MTESGIQARFLAWCRLPGNRRDTMARNCGAGTAGHVNGDPDCYGVTNGVPWVLEFKSPGKKPTALQRYQLMRWERCGVMAAWFDNLPEAKAWIALLRRRGDALKAMEADYPRCDRSTVVDLERQEYCPRSP